MIDVNTKELRDDLIALYEQFLKFGNNDFVKQKSEKIYSELYNADAVLDEELSAAIGPLDGLAWSGIIENSQRPALSKERAIKILENLKKNRMIIALAMGDKNERIRTKIRQEL